jgi:hypothetical protein
MNFKYVLDLLKEQPVAIALLFVIWLLFKRLKERDAQISNAWKHLGSVQESVGGLALVVGELTTLVKICCVRPRRGGK